MHSLSRFLCLLTPYKVPDCHLSFILLYYFTLDGETYRYLQGHLQTHRDDLEASSRKLG